MNPEMRVHVYRDVNTFRLMEEGGVVFYCDFHAHSR